VGELKCSALTSARLVSFGKQLNTNVEPQTCGNYFSHLSAIFSVAKPAWGYPLSRQELDDAVTVLKKLGLIRKGLERSRRPTLEELDQLMGHFGRIQNHRPASVPMQKIVAFALFSTRRQEEITLLRWADEDLRFHDLRHEGVSRLFEMGRTIPQAAAVSGHRS
jgi:integrase